MNFTFIDDLDLHAKYQGSIITGTTAMRSVKENVS